MTRTISPDTNRRLFEREETQIEFEVTDCNNNKAMYLTRNISKGGVQLIRKNNTSLELGEIVTIDTINTGYKIDLASVVHIDEKHISLAFIDMCLFYDLI